MLYFHAQLKHITLYFDSPSRQINSHGTLGCSLHIHFNPSLKITLLASIFVLSLCLFLEIIRLFIANKSYHRINKSAFYPLNKKLYENFPSIFFKLSSHNHTLCFIYVCSAYNKLEADNMTLM